MTNKWLDAMQRRRGSGAVDLNAIMGRVLKDRPLRPEPGERGDHRSMRSPLGLTQNSIETIFNYLEADGVKWEDGAFHYGDGSDSWDGEPSGVIWITTTKPSEAVRTRLKAAGMRWYPPKKLWYLPKTRYWPPSQLPKKTIAAFKKAIGFTPASLVGPYKVEVDRRREVIR
jgi:hypothetical protein